MKINRNFYLELLVSDKTQYQIAASKNCGTQRNLEVRIAK